MVDPDLTRRKHDHLELALGGQGASGRDPGWGDVHLVPRSVPGISADDVELTTSIAGLRLSAPLLFAPMTGGYPGATLVNARLGSVASRYGLAVGVGSQRAALVDPAVAETYQAVRAAGPGAVVLANLGVAQLVQQGDVPPLSLDQVRAAVSMVDADALTLHVNVVQELIQPGGDRNNREWIAAIAEVVSALDCPVIVKETGAGLDRESARDLAAVGVAALDVGGAGGTSFARIEAARARAAGADREQRMGALFRDWGIPTTAAILECRSAGLPVIATGGVRSGLDAAKALGLGAVAVGIGKPAAAEAQRSEEELDQLVGALVDELTTTMVLCGCSTVADLARRPPVLSGFTLEWGRQRGLLPEL